MTDGKQKWKSYKYISILEVYTYKIYIHTHLFLCIQIYIIINFGWADKNISNINWKKNYYEHIGCLVPHSIK